MIWGYVELHRATNGLQFEGFAYGIMENQTEMTIEHEMEAAK